VTHSILNDVLAMRRGDTVALDAYLERTGITVFEPIKGHPWRFDAILYILCAYSEDSPMVVLGRDSADEKAAICFKLQLPDDLAQAFSTLSDKAFKKCVMDYLYAFAGPEFQNVQFLRIQLANIQKIVTEMLCFTAKDDGEGVLTTEFDAATYSRLLKESREVAAAIARTEKDLKDRKRPFTFINGFFENVGRRRKSTDKLGPEQSELVK
jgi:hypothetical protein